MKKHWKVFLTVAALTPFSLFAEKLIIQKTEESSTSYVKSVYLNGIKNINTETWTPAAKGEYKGSINCVVNGEDVSVEMTFKSTGDDKKLYIFTADSGCGFIQANQKVSVPF